MKYQEKIKELKVIKFLTSDWSELAYQKIDKSLNKLVLYLYEKENIKKINYQGTENAALISITKLKRLTLKRSK